METKRKTEGPRAEKRPGNLILPTTGGPRVARRPAVSAAAGPFPGAGIVGRTAGRTDPDEYRYRLSAPSAAPRKGGRSSAAGAVRAASAGLLSGAHNLYGTRNKHGNNKKTIVYEFR